MLGFSRLVIDAGRSEAAALIVFKTTYLSYECFIQETKYELAGARASPGALRNGRLVHANNGLMERVEREKEAIELNSVVLGVKIHSYSAQGFSLWAITF